MNLALSLLLVLMLTAFAFGQDAGSGAKKLESDNCTWFPDGNYAECCVQHDREYEVGGSLNERKVSDKKLKRCVMSKGKGRRRRLLSNIMYLGVRVGGVHFLPTPFRWGFGNKWPRMRPPRVKFIQPVH